MADEVSEYDVILGLAGRVKLPPQPKVLLALNEEIKKKEPCFDKIAALIEQDPSMVAKVLKIVNSPFYSTSNNQMVSMVRALSTLGLRNFVCVVLASCLKDMVGVTEETMRIWSHTLLVAKASELVARKMGIGSPEAAYMAGLFRDSSVPLLLEKEPRYNEVMNMLVDDGGDVDAFEERHFGTSHSIMSYLLARSWGLPEAVCDAIHMHHCSDFSVFPSSESRSLAAVLMLADQLVRENSRKDMTEEVEDCYWPQIESQVFDELGIADASELDGFRESIAELAVEVG